MMYTCATIEHARNDKIGERCRNFSDMEQLNYIFISVPHINRCGDDWGGKRQSYARAILVDIDKYRFTSEQRYHKFEYNFYWARLQKRENILVSFKREIKWAIKS